MPRFAVWILSVGVVILGTGGVSGQAYPNKVIRIVTAAPGSNNDWGARVLAEEISPSLGQQVIVENRGGIAAEVVAKAPPDGYSLLFYGPAAWTLQLFRQVSYEPMRDLAPITLAFFAPAKTPSAIINRLNRELVLALKKENVKEKLLKGGVEAVGSSPEELAAYVKSDIARIEKLIKDAGIGTK